MSRQPNAKPLLFRHRGLWHAVQWPSRGSGSTPRAALVDLSLRRVLPVLLKPTQ